MKKPVKMKILAVDDDPTCRMALKMILETEFEVLIAGDSSEADDILEREKIDVLLMDINLADGESGLRLVGRYQGSGLLKPDTAVMILSSKALGADRLRPGIDSYQLKGMEPILREAIRNVLHRKRMPVRIRQRRFKMLKDFLPECLDAIASPKVFYDSSEEEGVVEVLTSELSKDGHPIRWNAYRLPDHPKHSCAVGVAPCIGCGRGCLPCMFRDWPLVRGCDADEMIGQHIHGLNSSIAAGFYEDPASVDTSFVLTHSGDVYAQNLDNSMEAGIRLYEAGLCRRIILTSTGDPRGHARYRKEYMRVKAPVFQYWSLHAARKALRDKILPATVKHDLSAQRDFYRECSEENGIRITASILHLPGVNDADADIDALWVLIGEGPFDIKIQPYQSPAGDRMFRTATMAEMKELKRRMVLRGFAPVRIRIKPVPGGTRYGGCGTAHPEFFPPEIEAEDGAEK